MRSHPRLASFALVLLATIHSYWGIRQLLGSSVFAGGMQLVAAGGLLLAAVAARDGVRGSIAIGAGVAAIATAARALPMLDAPFGPPTLALAGGFGALAYGAWRLDSRADAVGALAMRGGALVMAASYAGFLSLSVAFGGFGAGSVELVLRILAGLTLALALDAPRMFERKAFARGPASADG